jgi:transposase InsO family protein
MEGLPETIVMDNGPQLTSREFQNFCEQQGISHLTSAPFHPESNGEAERFVQSLKQGIKKNCGEGETTRSTLKAALQKFLATYRCLPHPALDWKSPAELLHGRQPRVLLSLLHPTNLKGSAHISEQSDGSSTYNIDSLVYAKNYGS